MRYGTFTFQATPSGAYIFDFHDSDNGETIENIILIKPAITWGELKLQWYPPLAVDYREDIWQPETVDSHIILTNANVPNCKVQEWEPSEVQGKYKNTISIGEIVYEIYSCCVNSIQLTTLHLHAIIRLYQKSHSKGGVHAQGEI